VQRGARPASLRTLLELLHQRRRLRQRVALERTAEN
jgi:hypothetical protein